MQPEQTKAAREFSEYWKDKGKEKQEAQKFWIDLLQNVIGVVDATKIIDFEKEVKIGATKFIDGYIAETKTIIEQKGAKIDLSKAEKQSAETVLYVKQHSVNCIPAALYMVVKNFGGYFEIGDARKFIDDMFKNPEGFSSGGAEEVRAHIKNAFESYLEKSANLEDSEWFLPVRDFLENYGK